MAVVSSVEDEFQELEAVKAPLGDPFAFVERGGEREESAGERSYVLLNVVTR